MRCYASRPERRQEFLFSLGQGDQIVIPKAIRTNRNILPVEDFEVITDEDDLDLILLRRIRPAANSGLVAHLASSPNKGALPVPPHRREPMRPVRL